MKPYRPTPRWMSVVEDLQRRIKAGDFTDGKLPTQQDLKAEYRVSIATLERACSILERDGLISRQQGARARILRTEYKSPATDHQH